MSMTFLRSLIVFFSLLFSTSLSHSNDISEFQIEGMSIGDSALDFFNKSVIKENITDYYSYLKTKDYISTEIYDPNNFNAYDSIEIFFKRNDSQYIIQGIAGGMFFKNNIEDCYSKRDTVVNALKNIFPNARIDGPHEITHPADKSGQSIYYGTWFWVNEGTSQVSCYDWSENKPYTDHLLVSILLNEIDDWLNNY